MAGMALKPQWVLFIATISIFFGGLVGVVTTDFASMLGAGVLFFAASFAGVVWYTNRKKKRMAGDVQDEASAEEAIEDSEEQATDDTLFQRDPFQRDRVIELYMDELGLTRDKAENLYDAGYAGWSDFSEAIPEDLVMVNGINPTVARRIISTIRSKDVF